MCVVISFSKTLIQTGNVSQRLCACKYSQCHRRGQQMSLKLALNKLGTVLPPHRMTWHGIKNMSSVGDDSISVRGWGWILTSWLTF